MENQEFTHGEMLVGISFNVGNRDDVATCKKRFAEAIDQLEEASADAYENGTLTSNKEAIINEAKMRILDAQMWAVKALTYGS